MPLRALIVDFDSSGSTGFLTRKRGMPRERGRWFERNGGGWTAEYFCPQREEEKACPHDYFARESVRPAKDLGHAGACPSA